MQQHAPRGRMVRERARRGADVRKPLRQRRARYVRYPHPDRTPGVALVPELRRLFDFRSAEKRGVALARYDAEFASWQAWMEAQRPPYLSPWERLREALK